jgi:hypothetical protein
LQSAIAAIVGPSDLPSSSVSDAIHAHECNFRETFNSAAAQQVCRITLRNEIASVG